MAVQTITEFPPGTVNGQSLTSGVYRTGPVPSLGLVGNLTQNAQGDPSTVYISQIEATLVTAADSRTGG